MRDARLAAAAGLVPLIGLIFILRLVQWYLLKNQYPSLMNAKGKHASLAKEFRSAKIGLWVAVLLWPTIIAFLAIYMAVTS